MKAFTQAGGRLFRIALIFTFVCIGVAVVQAFFLHRAMVVVEALAREGIEVPMFFERLITFLDLGKVVASLSAVLIAIAARYGARETARNISEGRVNKSRVSEEAGK